jgi:methyl coenzyme M reductase subunit D
MRFRFVPLFAVAVAAIAQSSEQTRVFTFAHSETPRQAQDILNAMRMIGEITQTAMDAGAGALTVGGSADQIALATWLFTELDRPSGDPPKALLVRESSFADPRNPIVKLFYPAHLSTPQHIQEVVNAVRSIAEVQRVAALSSLPAILVRGDAAGTNLAEWLIRELDSRASGAAGNGLRQTTFADSVEPPQRRTPEVRIYYPARITSPLDIQETVNGVRTIAEMQRVVAVGAARPSIVLRGNADQTAIAEWVLRQLDQEPPAAGPKDFEPADPAYGIVRAIYLPKTTTQDLSSRVAGIRESTGIQRAVIYTRLRGILLRGAADQLAKAETLLH